MPSIAVTNLEITFKEPESASLPIPTRFITLKDETRPTYTYTTLADIVDNYVPSLSILTHSTRSNKTSRMPINELAALYAFISAPPQLRFIHFSLLGILSYCNAYHSFSLKPVVFKEAFHFRWKLEPLAIVSCVSTHLPSPFALFKEYPQCPLSVPSRPPCPSAPSPISTSSTILSSFGDSSEYKLFSSIRHFCPPFLSPPLHQGRYRRLNGCPPPLPHPSSRASHCLGPFQSCAAGSVRFRCQGTLLHG